MDYLKTQADIDHRGQEIQRKYSELVAEVDRVFDELELLQREVLGLREMEHGIQMALGQRPVAVPGLTEHIRMIMCQTKVPLTPLQIRESCEGVGIKGSSRKTLLITVHSVLKRLEARRVYVDGKVAYSPNPLARAGSIR